MGWEQRVLKAGIVAMCVAAAFTFAAVVVILILRVEPTPALASERVVLAADKEPARPVPPPKLLPGPERAKPETVRQEAQPFQPQPERVPSPQPEPEKRPEPKPEPEPEPKPEQRAKAQPKAQVQAPEPKPEPKQAPEPKPEPEPETDRAAGRSAESGPARGGVQRAAAQRAKPERAKPERAEPKRSERRAKPKPSRPSAGEPRRSALPAGVTMALSISTLGLRDVPVRSSASQRALDNGAIHLPDTSLPWDDGAGGRNVYLAGHRLGYPGTGSHRIFYRLDELRKGDEIVVKDRRGRTYQYRVTGSRVVAPSDSWVKRPVPGRDMLSLQTCTPISTLERRLIVRANRV